MEKQTGRHVYLEFFHFVNVAGEIKTWNVKQCKSFLFFSFFVFHLFSYNYYCFFYSSHKSARRSRRRRLWMTFSSRHSAVTLSSTVAAHLPSVAQLVLCRAFARFRKRSMGGARGLFRYSRLTSTGMGTLQPRSGKMQHVKLFNLVQ